ncbi:hypothetical protein NPIL_572451 [Nephila pilipes]|uniref:Uncharacterized protein n=1 Tax=Nephila pilipes TaxID=299642 RepID=A0A8X6P2S2_NEPPI|nr:hypothetical protein NPIL_572451 [Nephila pilipes]
MDRNNSVDVTSFKKARKNQAFSPVCLSYHLLDSGSTCSTIYHLVILLETADSVHLIFYLTQASSQTNSTAAQFRTNHSLVETSASAFLALKEPLTQELVTTLAYLQLADNSTFMHKSAYVGTQHSGSSVSCP